MIRFFRKIRRQLLSQNRFSKYMLYAVGEIVLVMVGILLALQVNNWNEERKLKRTEINMLISFKTSLERDLKGLKNGMTFNQRTKRSMNLLIKYIEDDLPYHDSLSNHFGNTIDIGTFIINDGAYENLKSKGLHLISNERLQQELSNFYTLFNVVTLNRFERYRDYLEHASRNLLNTRFDAYWESNFSKLDMFNVDEIIWRKTPNDFDLLKKDKEYMFFLKTLKNYHIWYIEYEYQRIEHQINLLLEHIKEELD